MSHHFLKAHFNSRAKGSAIQVAEAAALPYICLRVLQRACCIFLVCESVGSNLLAWILRCGKVLPVAVPDASCFRVKREVFGSQVMGALRPSEVFSRGVECQLTCKKESDVQRWLGMQLWSVLVSPRKVSGFTISCRYLCLVCCQCGSSNHAG